MKLARLYLAGATVLASVLIATPALASASGCTSKIVTFDVTGLRLNERISATWKYGAGADDLLHGTAILQTVQSMRTQWTGRRRAAASFDELIGQCRVGDRFQGSIRITTPQLRSHVQGSWSAGTRSGSCTTDGEASRSLRADFIRRSLSATPPAKTLGVRWTIGAPAQLDCPFMALHRDGSYSPAHLRRVEMDYPQEAYVIRKSLLLGHSRVLRLPIHARASAKRGHAGWRDGSTTATLALDGTVTLRRARICTIGPNDPILNNPCLKP